jgi:DNA mismatch repair protein MutS
MAAAMTTEQISPIKLTPMMQQWQACKERAGTALLLFRMGDFYEAFYDDAALIARELDLTLTKRQEVPMSGIPVHTCETYLDRLVAKGYRVAVAEQTEDPKQTKGLVNRQVVRTVTPGTVVSSSLLSDSCNNYIVAVTRVGSRFGLAVLDVTTAEFRTVELDDTTALCNELHRLRPSEIIASAKFLEKQSTIFDETRQGWNCAVHAYEQWHFEHQQAHDYLTQHFGVISLDGFGLQGLVAAINAAGALLHYVRENLSLSIDHVRSLTTYASASLMTLDRATQRHLELTENARDGGSRNTLLSVLDHTATPMGARLLRHWIKHPLLDPAAIIQRQDDIECLHRQQTYLQSIKNALEGVRDLERLVTKVTTGYVSPRDLLALRLSLERIPLLQQHMQEMGHHTAGMAGINSTLAECPPVAPIIAKAIVDEPPLRLSEGQIFRTGYHAELDELRRLGTDSKAWIADYQQQLRTVTGIKTLKVGYNRMFGYYIEVSRGQSERMPPQFERRQTLVNAERFITSELKVFEQKVLTAAERCSTLENELFHLLRQQIIAYRQPLQTLARAVAYLDTCASMAHVAHQHNYVRPTVDNSVTLHVEAGRHPVIEAGISQSTFTPNDVTLDSEDNRLMLITGPNMAGKSTFIRQVALIVLMAQIGSFVPARQAHVGIVDKIFTRIGASDDLTRGLSTFMVEMTETATILHGATNRSLVILDEIGRGTSTYDGISIAWAVAEHLLTTPTAMPKTLFATHYWELTQMEGLLPGAVNFNVAVHEAQGQIHFLHKIVKGSADKSYGIHVARLAGLPLTTVTRAHEILQQLEGQAQRYVFSAPAKPRRQTTADNKKSSDTYQLTFFGS